MSNEASKTLAVWGDDMRAVLRGEGLDIGAGAVPVLPGVDRFDKEHGDANRITRYVRRQFDFVFASHVLEHMNDPYEAAKDWFSLVRPGGHLVVLVPDEDLYEQGSFPSLFNSDHKHTFTISKAVSWSPRSVNLLDLACSLKGELVNIELHDHGYDRRLLRHSPGRARLCLRRLMIRLSKDRSVRTRLALTRLFSMLGAPIDQTTFLDARLAQIQLVLRRTA
jgi:SAM-dependent methyltransferase